jgi:hypothetical protein
MASQKPPNSPTIPNTPPSSWVDRGNSYGGWPELCARLDGIKAALNRILTNAKVDMPNKPRKPR